MVNGRFALRPWLEGAIIALSGAFLFLQRGLPVMRITPGAEVRARPGAGGAAGDALLLVDGGAVERSAARGRFSALDCSHSWINVLERAFGPAPVAELTSFDPDGTRVPRVLIVGGRGGAPEPAWASRLAARGHVVVLDGPALAAGTREPDGPARPGRLEAGAGLPRDPQTADRLPRVPLLEKGSGTFSAAEKVPDPFSRIWITLDGAPALVVERATGGGGIVRLGFNLAQALVALQQGVPEEDLTVRNRFPDAQAAHLESNDLVAHRSLLDAPAPLADELERVVVAAVDSLAPVAGWWAFPALAEGVFLMTHDDEALGDDAAWFAEYEADRGIASTHFLIRAPALTAAGVARMTGKGGEVGLHGVLRDGPWDFDPFETVSLLGIGLLRRLPSLAEQAAGLEALAPGDRVLLHRSHFLLVPERWTGLFRQLEAAGFQGDSSWGPDWGGRGYLFGTGLPFHPLDESGLPFQLHEVPLLWSEDVAGVDRSWIEGLFARSAERDHQAITALFHPAWSQTPGHYDLWRSTYAIAASHGHPTLPLGRFLEFWRARRGSAIESRWQGGTLTVRAEARTSSMAVTFPERTAGRRLTSVRLEGSVVVPDVRQVGARRLARVRVPAGASIVEADYAPEDAR